ncbi:ATP-binding protein [Streptomyces collinus]|uniref:ATP-binding protein n=1 Tax=Streptomyces collinus TaxID=42684 RepID=UPI002942CBB7|nr:ATP-binding protein [Streptomyces collinus]
MGTPAPAGAPSWRLAPVPENAASARHFVRSALDGVAPDLAATAELLTGELVTNVVIHARTEAEVRVAVAEGRVQVRVSDRRPERGLVPHDRHPYASTGRGLALVEELATSYGVHSGDGVKTVWFELWPEPPAPPASVWETVPPVGPTVTVALNDVPYALYWAAQLQWEGALRELIRAAVRQGGHPADRGTGPRHLLRGRQRPAAPAHPLQRRGAPAGPAAGTAPGRRSGTGRPLRPVQHQRPGRRGLVRLLLPARRRHRAHHR